MNIIQIISVFLITLPSLASTTNRVLLKFVTEENKAAWIRLGCFKAEQFEGTNIVVLPDTAISFENNICLPHRGAYHTCYEGSINVAESIARKMADNTDGFKGFSLLSKKIIKEKNLSLTVQYVLRKNEELLTETNNGSATVFPCQ